MTTTPDIAKRVYDHAWKLDPIIRSLLDTDFYKLLMLQMIWRLHRGLQVTFSVVNRTTSVRIAEEIEGYVIELGADGRLVMLQLEELVGGVEDDRRLVAKDYFMSAPDWELQEIGRASCRERVFSSV